MKKPRLHYLQHVPFEGPGCIGTWAEAAGCHLSGSRLYRPHRLPAMEQFDWLVIMGGPMSVHAELRYPWLAAEKAFIDRAIEAGKVVLGICLGGQLIAADESASGIASAEKKMRGGADEQCGLALLVTGNTAPAVKAACGSLLMAETLVSHGAVGPCPLGIYELVFDLSALD